MIKILKKYPGFTFIELLFAIVVMGILFSIALVVFVGMLRFYVFAGSVRQNQENGRNVLDSITRDVRFGQLVYPSVPSATVYDKVCYYDPNSKKIKGYVATNLATSSSTLEKFESSASYESYDLAKAASSDCGLTTKGTLSGNQLPKSMYLTDFSITRTGGAGATAYSSVSAITIKLGFITQTAGTVAATCEVRNIYCNKNTYNTAVEIRGTIYP